MIVRKKQEGVVLLVSLILLLITTLVGYSVMETSSLEAKMAISKQGKEESFQAVESLIERAIADEALIQAALNVHYAGGTTWPTQNYTFSYDSDLSGTATMRWLDWANTQNGGLGPSAEKYHFFEVSVVDTRSGSNLGSRHVQAFYRILPGT